MQAWNSQKSMGKKEEVRDSSRGIDKSEIQVVAPPKEPVKKVEWPKMVVKEVRNDPQWQFKKFSQLMRAG